MAVFDQHFYHKTISLLTGVFGSVFDDIKIVRKDGKIIRVPIAYAVKRRSEVRKEQNPSPNTIKYKMQLPRLSFKLVGLVRDPSRTTNKLFRLRDVESTSSEISAQYNRVPYRFLYTLSAKAKTMDDMLQIVEQILVQFNPTLRVIVKDNPNLNEESAITIKLLDSGIDEIFEGSFEMEEAIETNIQFELEGWLYMPTKDTKIITKTIVDVYDITSNEVLEQIVEEP